MGRHDQHLPRRHLNRAADTRGAPEKLVKEIVKAQGTETKRDAKKAKAGRGE